MKTDHMNQLFDDLKDEFDIEAPHKDHSKRFLDKLNRNAALEPTLNSGQIKVWKPFIGIAASLLLLVSLIIINPFQNKDRDLANVSSEMEKTQNFFMSTISEDLKKLKQKSDPETETIISDALVQIDKLESDYTKLKSDLAKSGDDRRVIYAMISNFQNRIDILQNTLDYLEQLKQLNTYTHENISHI